jgi:hypothetical protein
MPSCTWCLAPPRSFDPAGSPPTTSTRQRAPSACASSIARRLSSFQSFAVKKPPRHRPVTVSPFALIARAGNSRLLAYHICDWLVPTRDLLNDRGMMGDGVVDLPKIRGMMERAGYVGFHEVEIFSKLDWWQRDPDEVIAICKDRHVKVT